ncbi:MAG: exodeoxyribonuclease VII large subunit [Candidatus Coatesbacteria bacterium]
MTRKKAETGELFAYAPEPEARDGIPVYTVSQLASEIKALIETAHPAVYVRGEVTGYRGVHSSGHLYFQVKDENAVLDVAMFRGANRNLKFELENGMEVLVFGRATAYPRRSTYQIIAEAVEPAGLGALQARIEAVKKALAAEGLFDDERKRPLPSFPHAIALVTSPEGAAVTDFLKVTRRRFPGQHIVVFPVLVQGDDAPAQIVEAIRDANAMGGFDLLALCRGGGSIEDLMAFNDEAVCRAIAASELPVVTGIGHERDVTIADFVADVRASTPSQAAEFVTPSRSDLAREIREARERMERSLRSVVESQAQDLDDATEGLNAAARNLLKDLESRLRDLATRLRGASPVETLKRQRQLMEQLGSRLAAGVTRRVGEADQRMKGLTGRLHALSPLAVLGRGYAIAFALPGGEVVKDAAKVTPGQDLEIRLAKGSVRATARAIMEDLP